MKRRSLVGLLVWVGAGTTGGPACAQAPVARPAAAWAIKAAFLPLLADGYHLQAERFFANSRHSLCLTPQWYQGRTTAFTSEPTEGGYGQVRGGGVELQHRIYLGPQPERAEGAYVAYGPIWQRFTMDYQAVGSWQQAQAANGLTYYDYRLGNQTETINRWGASAVAGKQLPLLGTPLVLDLYAGLGWRAVRTRSTATPGRFASGLNDYGHHGVFVPVGVRLGWVL